MFVKFKDPYGDDVVINSDMIVRVIGGVTSTAYPKGEYCELSVKSGVYIAVKGDIDNTMRILNGERE